MGKEEHVQQSDLVVPCPDVSVLLQGKRMCAMLLSDNLMHPRVRLLASTSLSIHQEDTIANRLG